VRAALLTPSPVRVTHMNDSCHISEYVMSHIWMSHITHLTESCHPLEWDISHIWMSHFKHLSESCQTSEWVMSNIWMSHVMIRTVKIRLAHDRNRTDVTGDAHLGADTNTTTPRWYQHWDLGGLLRSRQVDSGGVLVASRRSLLRHTYELFNLRLWRSHTTYVL